MSKKNGSGFAALVAGVAAGAAAVFLSKKENREKTKKVLVKAEKKIVRVSREVKKDPKRFAKKVEKSGKVLAKKVVKEAAKDLRRANSSSPVLKRVGKTVKKSVSKVKKATKKK